MRIKSHKEYIRQKERRHRHLVWMLVLCLLLNYMNIYFIPVYAADNGPVSFEVGSGMTAVLNEGVLTLSGQGRTNDYSEETAPFLDYASEIHTLVIEDGVTYIGAYLFYGLGKLAGELTLPGSIAGFGDYAFSGKNPEDAPKFTVIRNEFVNAEAISPVQAGLPGDDMPLPENGTSADIGPAADDASDESMQKAEDAVSDDLNLQDTIIDNSRQAKDVPQVQTITSQEINRPETLFAAGQTGFAICRAENATFAISAQTAGYQVADSSVRLILDDAVDMELPVTGGQVCLPECPEEIKSFHQEDSFYSYEFAGWSQTQPGDAQSAAAPGQYLGTGGSAQIALCSVWNPVSKYQIKTKSLSKGATAVYTLVNGESEDDLEAPKDYIFLYQWQMAEKGAEGEMDWTDIDGAGNPVYERAVESTDAGRQFRCKVTAVKQTRTRDASEPVTLYSQGTDAALEMHIVYVDQTAGDDNNDGAQGTPFKTLTKAAEYLGENNPGGTVETNQIVLLKDYAMNNGSPSESTNGMILNGGHVDLTISGTDSSIKLVGNYPQNAGNDEKVIEVSGNIKLEGLTLASSQHIYANGYDITIGKNVTSPSTYLYGMGRSPLPNSEIKVGKIKVESGNFARIAGYARSYTDPSTNGILDVKNTETNITVSGGANVDSIISGSASGGIANGNVKISVEDGGSVTKIVGGNQGYLNAKSPFTGSTDIKVSGGSVGEIFGAGTGRNASIPTYQGNLNIEVTGGHVNNIYGAGSAAFIKSENGMSSSVNISAKGGTIGNIYAAGKGNESAVSLKNSQTNPASQYDFDKNTPPEKFGSLQGTATITISNDTVISGNIYASGSGDSGAIPEYSGNGLKENAYLDGSVTITMNGGTVKGNIYGGGKGIASDGYAECARVEQDSTVKVMISGGTVEGSVFGGGENGKVKGNTDVAINGGIIKGNVYGGSKNAVVEGKTNVTVSGGTIESSVYGGSLGTAGSSLVHGGATVNMTGGWVKKNVYGGSEKSDDGVVDENATGDLILVNITGGTVTRNVFGGGYLGEVYGSTHVHIGKEALGKCNYYKANPSAMPSLAPSVLLIEGSVYAGGDFGGGSSYDEITITGTSHVYIDGNDYDTGGGNTNDPDMRIEGGVFGSGASCDAGSTRLVTLDYYGALVNGGAATDTTRTLEAIQRADRVLMINSNVRLTGKSDIANSNTTALYSLNRIGDHENPGMEAPGKGLVLKGGSTVILDSEAIGLGRFSSIDASGQTVVLDKVGSADGQTPNRICFDAGTVFRVAVEKDKKTEYGEVSGYAYMEAGDTAEVFAYARIKTDSANKTDGGFVDPDETQQGKEISYSNVGTEYRFWQMKKDAGAVAERETVLTVQELQQNADGYLDGDYSVAEGTIELPHASDPTTYTISQISLADASGLTLAEAARDGLGTGKDWITSQTNSDSGDSIDLEAEKAAIKDNPLSHFGLFMDMGDGFEASAAAKGKVISAKSMVSADNNTIIGAKTAVTKGNTMPKIKFYLTYGNKGITASRKLGTIVIRLEGINSKNEKTTIDMKAEIISKATALSDQSIDLYATQNGSYTGRLTIPAGTSRSLKLQNVDAGVSVGDFVSYDSPSISGQQFGISMQPVQSSGWSEINLVPQDLGVFGQGSPAVIGTTDIRYEASIEFNLKNAPGFEAKETPDAVKVTLIDGAGQTTKITLNIHWKASIASNVQLAAGRNYGNDMGVQDTLAISPKSAVTTQFTLSNATSIDSLWLELKNTETGEVAALPAHTQLTLATDTEFYTYTVTGSEADNRVRISQFKQMWGTVSPTGNAAAGAVWNIITDFSGAKTALTPGSYGLRLREEKSADSQDDHFTVNNSGPAVTIDAPASSLSKGEYSITLNSLPNNDTRFTGSSTALLMLENGIRFPVGTVVSYTDKDKTYSVYPRGEKIYLPMPESGSRTFMINTTDTAGLEEGEISIKAMIMPGGISSGAKWESIASNTVKASVAGNPETALAVALRAGERVVKAKDSLEFAAKYTCMQTNPAAIEIKVQKKNEDGSYLDAGQWNVSGNVSISGTGTQNIQVTVPDSIAAGTYRLVFSLGGKKAVYNLIVE